MALRASDTGLICWPMGAADFRNAAYGREIAVEVKDALISSGDLELVQKARLGLSAVFLASKDLAPGHLSFRKHGIGPVVEVRATKPERYGWNGLKVKGKILPLKRFKGRYEDLEDQMLLINRVMARHPLRSPDVREWIRCKRIFNDGRLDRGGRLYGDWQSEKASDRLHFTIDGQPVCEIDIKGSYLFLAYKLSGGKEANLGRDPYQLIEFVRCGPPEMRDLAKELVSALLSGSPCRTTFPRGKTKDADGKAISFRKRYAIPRSRNITYYTRHIFRAFPFVATMDRNAGELMFRESEVMVEALLDLARRPNPIVAYPIHDCLLCKRSDEQEVVSALQRALMRQLGGIPYMDVEYFDLPTKIIEPPETTEPVLWSGQNYEQIPEGSLVQTWGTGDDRDFDVIEE